MEKAGRVKKEKLTKSRDRVKKHGEVYTPMWMCVKMCDALPPDAWTDIGAKFLEPCCGNGNFLEEILRRKLALAKEPKDILLALRSICAIVILPDNVEESRDRMRRIAVEKYSEFITAEYSTTHIPVTVDVDLLRQIHEITEQNVICGDALKILKYLRDHDWKDLKGKDWG